MTVVQSTYTPDPTCLVSCEGHLCRRRDGQLLDGNNGVCHAGARLQIQLETAACAIIATVQFRDKADQAAREADARLRCYLEQQLTWIRPVFVQRRLRDLLQAADHAALIAEGWETA